MNYVGRKQSKKVESMRLAKQSKVELCGEDIIVRNRKWRSVLTRKRSEREVKKIRIIPVRARTTPVFVIVCVHASACVNVYAVCVLGGRDAKQNRIGEKSSLGNVKLITLYSCLLILF